MVARFPGSGRCTEWVLALADSPPPAISESPCERDLILLRSIGHEPKTRVLDMLFRENRTLGRQCSLSSMAPSGIAFWCLFHGHVTWSINAAYTFFRLGPALFLLPYNSHTRAGSLIAMLLLSIYTVYSSEIREKCCSRGCHGGGEATVVMEAQKS